MESRSTQDARRDFAALMEDVIRGEHVELTRYGRPVAVIVPHEWHEVVTALIAELETYEAWRERMAAIRQGRRAARRIDGQGAWVHHVDGDPRNNDPGNLRIVDPRENAPGRIGDGR